MNTFKDNKKSRKALKYFYLNESFIPKCFYTIKAFFEVAFSYSFRSRKRL